MGNQVQIMKLTKSKQFKPNSVILITGATSGIGRELALQYATRKVRLLLCSRAEDKLQEVTELCRQLGSQCNYRKTDVSIENDCKEAVEECIRVYGRIDILVLSAGVNAHSYFEDIKDMSIFRKIMDVNFYGYVYCTRYALPHLRKSSGQIIVMSSFSGEVGIPSRVPYCSSKFAVTGFFEALRAELDDFNVAITIICPPSVATPMRNNDLLNKKNEKNEQIQPVESEDTRISTEEAVKIILDAADRRARKIFFPFNVYLLAYIRPFLPDQMDKIVKARSKL